MYIREKKLNRNPIDLICLRKLQTSLVYLSVIRHLFKAHHTYHKQTQNFVNVLHLSEISETIHIVYRQFQVVSSNCIRLPKPVKQIRFLLIGQ